MSPSKHLRLLSRIERFLGNWSRTRMGRCIACDAYSGHQKACAWKAAGDALAELVAQAQLTQGRQQRAAEKTKKRAAL